MENIVKCPICGKEGIPDFHKEDVVCPCCGSDLSVYHKLYDMSSLEGQENSHNNKNIYYLAGLCALLLVCSCSFAFWMMNSNHQKYIEIGQLEKKITHLNESINQLKLSRTQTLTKQFASQEQGITGTTKSYCVKKGDSFCRISKQELGSENRYREIITLNGLNAKSILHEGDSLKLPMK